ncbi:probable asparagine--tRNA ligase, mitochondrial, partial [Nephila pilipes]
VKGKLADTLLSKNKDSNVSSTNSDSESDDESEVLNLEHNKDLSEKYFFGAPAFLTVSGQLHLESVASALTRVYSFGPTFRAEASRTKCHASEFQMIEAEISFIENVDDLITLVEKCVKKIIESIVDSCPEEINFLSKDLKKHDQYVKNLTSKSFVKMSYKDAITVLQSNKKSLKVPIE